MAAIPNRLLPAILVPISLLVIIVIGFAYRRRIKKRRTQKENSDDVSSGEYSTPYAFEDYETPYANDIYEEYTIITNGSQKNTRNISSSSTPAQSRKNVSPSLSTRRKHSPPSHHSKSSVTSGDSQCGEDFVEKVIEETPIEKPDAFLPGYIYQLKKAGKFDKVQEVLKENGYSVDPIAVTGKNLSIID